MALILRIGFSSIKQKNANRTHLWNIDFFFVFFLRNYLNADLVLDQSNPTHAVVKTLHGCSLCFHMMYNHNWLTFRVSFSVIKH